MRKILSTVAVLALLSSPVHAQQQRYPCAESDLIAKQLTERYKEAPVSGGLMSNGNLLTVWASEDGKTWTVTTTTPSGTSCVIAAGGDWESVPFVSKDPEA